MESLQSAIKDQSKVWNSAWGGGANPRPWMLLGLQDASLEEAKEMREVVAGGEEGKWTGGQPGKGARLLKVHLFYFLFLNHVIVIPNQKFDLKI